MSVTFEINAEVRADKGKGASRRLRHANRIPAVLYGGSEDPVSLSVDHDKLMHALENEAFYSHILTINVDGKGVKAVLRDLQRHPAKNMLLHADFQRIDASAKLHMHVPLHFLNEETARGVKEGGGIIQRNVVEVEVTCLPKDLPEYLEIDVANLELGHSLHLSDIKLPEGVELVQLTHGADHDLPVVGIQKTRGGSDSDDAEAGEAAEGEDKE